MERERTLADGRHYWIVSQDTQRSTAGFCCTRARGLDGSGQVRDPRAASPGSADTPLALEGCVGRAEKGARLERQGIMLLS